MARCKECIHYAVCAKEGRMVQVDGHTWDDYNQLDNVECFCENYISTADVAPRAEVEELIYRLEYLLCHATGGRLSKHTYDLLTMETAVTDYLDESYCEGKEEGYKNAKAEVATEIFNDITKMFFEKQRQYENSHQSGKARQMMIARFEVYKLQKKYTGDTK